MSFTELLIAALATWQAVEIWHHSALFAGSRAGAEIRGGWIGALLGCPWCLSVWVAAWVAVVVLQGMPDVPYDRGFLAFLLKALTWFMLVVCKLFVYTLAISRLANLGSDYFNRYCLTPHENRRLPDPPPETITTDGNPIDEGWNSLSPGWNSPSPKTGFEEEPRVRPYQPEPHDADPAGSGFH